MTREEAIRILDPDTTGEALAEIEYYGGFIGKAAAVQAVSDACILAVSALREQEQRRWIPVTERLPEEEGLYLVAVVNDHERRYSKTAWYHGHGNWFLHQKVTHWMPLPEPPKGE